LEISITEDFVPSYYSADGVYLYDAGSIFIDKGGEFEILKFAFPGLKEGSIIEYEFTLKGGVLYVYAFIPNWSFQGYYPKLWSEYIIEIPDICEW
jgi:hypothetical protein